MCPIIGYNIIERVVVTSPEKNLLKLSMQKTLKLGSKQKVQSVINVINDEYKLPEVVGEFYVSSKVTLHPNTVTTVNCFIHDTIHLVKMYLCM